MESEIQQQQQTSNERSNEQQKRDENKIRIKRKTAAAALSLKANNHFLLWLCFCLVALAPFISINKISNDDFFYMTEKLGVVVSDDDAKCAYRMCVCVCEFK